MPMWSASSCRSDVSTSRMMWYECVLAGKAPKFPPDDALRNMAAILALYESADTGKTVAVERL